MNWRTSIFRRRVRPYAVQPSMPPASKVVSYRSTLGPKALLAAGGVSLGLHGLIAFVVLPAASANRFNKGSYNVRVLQRRKRTPKPLPPPPPDKAKPRSAPRPPARAVARPRRLRPASRPQPAKPRPAPRKAAPPPPVKPVFGVSKDSLALGGGTGGITMPVGTTLMKEPDAEITPPRKVPKVAVAPPPPPPPRPRPRPRPRTYNLTQVTERPRLIKRVVPRYTGRAEDAEVEGVVKLEVIIDTQGRPISVKVLKRLGYGLDQQAVIAVKRCRFSPAKVKGRPVKCRLVIPFRFRLP